MHQKNSQAAEPSSASLHNDDDDDLDLKDPFADGDDDLDEDDDILREGGRGAWWRDMVTRQANMEEQNPDYDNDNDDDEEFGDFAMAEGEKGKGDDNVVLKPMAVNPAKEGSNRGGFGGLWPFGTKEKTGQQQSEGEGQGQKDTGDASPVDVAAEHKTGEESSQPSPAVEVKEAKRRTSIEDPDEEEAVKV